MALQVYTSQFSYRGSDRLDITVKTGDLVFAPKWDMVMGHKSGAISDDEYKKRYVKMMKESYRNHRPVWDELLSRERVTLVCYCRKGNFCHRLLLAKMIVILGAEYRGEI